MKLLRIGIIFLFLHGCSTEEPMATTYKKQLQSSNQVLAPVLGFRDPIYSEEFGLPSNENVDGKSLLEILASQEAGRDDGKLCSSCHNINLSLGGYSVPSEPDEAMFDMNPLDIVSGRPWAGSNGWAERFLGNDSKPSNLKAFIRAWRGAGYLNTSN